MEVWRWGYGGMEVWRWGYGGVEVGVWRKEVGYGK